MSLPRADLLDLSGKVALITGSSRGIGRAIARALAGCRATVIISSRNREACETVRDEIVSDGGYACACPCNVASRDDLQKLVDFTLRECGRVDTVVCNAAVNPYFGPMTGVEDEVYDKVMTANLRSRFWLCNMAAPAMKSGGSIILISSIQGLRGSATLGLYGLSKAADQQLVRSLAMEWGPSGIRANAIIPGLIKTDFAKALWQNPQFLARRLRETALNRIGLPEDIAGAAVFLASDASSYMTGQSLIIDGGVMAGQPLSAIE